MLVEFDRLLHQHTAEPSPRFLILDISILKQAVYYVVHLVGDGVY
jgi:hypothetical protein